ncbi:MAG: VWA domain-containing protein [Opitutae bacterium]|nr:VWA domain-containing protein [Opitutae bacterium]
MKSSHLILLLAVALSGATSLFCKSAAEQPVRLRVDVDRGVLPAGSTEKAVVKIGLDCLRLPPRSARPPVNLALVIDRSGSMSGDKIERAREAALELVRRLAPDDVISIVAYDTQVETLVPARRVGNARGLEAAIRSIEAAGNTALHGGVMRGAAEVRRHIEDGRYVNRVILLSDGLANVGPSSPEELGRLGHSLMKEGISVTTIGLGLGFNEDLMTRLASRSDGNTYFVENSDDLPGIFNQELGDVLNVVARRVVIEIDFPAGVRPVNFVGREGSIRGQKAELTLNQLYGGQEKFALIEVEVSPEQAGAEREIARARVSYDDAVNQRAGSATAQRTVSFSADEKIVVKSADHQVQADYAANLMALAKDTAIALVDSGRKSEAAALLRQRAGELKELGSVYANSAVSAAASAAEPEAARLERDGLDNARRKSYRTDSQQVKNQQSSAASRP